MDETYQRSLIKSYKKLADDGLFNFILIDMINDKVNAIDEISSHANLRGYKVFIIELNENDAATCYQKNIHKRSLNDIEQV